MPLEENDNPVFEIVADLSKKDEIARLVDRVGARLGTVDILVNCATYRRWPHLLSSDALDAIDPIFALNLFAPLRLSVAVANAFWRGSVSKNAEYNRNIVSVSSSAGLYVYPDLGQGLYASAKAALNQLTYHLASEFWDIAVRVNAIAPDSFPGRISVERVCDAIYELDGSDVTGEVRPILPSSPVPLK
jgi:NAD(P)-dependent dehydrogenase (short-subunit alcohol dehydrogenase family)